MAINESLQHFRPSHPGAFGGIGVSKAPEPMKPFKRIVQLEQHRHELLGELIAGIRTLGTLQVNLKEKLSIYEERFGKQLNPVGGKTEKTGSIDLNNRRPDTRPKSVADHSAWLSFRDCVKEFNDRFSKVSKLQDLLESIDRKIGKQLDKIRNG